MFTKNSKWEHLKFQFYTLKCFSNIINPFKNKTRLDLKKFKLKNLVSFQKFSFENLKAPVDSCWLSKKPALKSF